ncbi:MAG: methylmalonyl Co-A mutase-associated GTPase MeaB [Myxococcales bacterium]|nr:methylmalonyl Co-A mutase-associated GTPase MeaB [Myxococcales bacterium]
MDLDALEAGVLAGDRAALGRAITLVESTAPRHQAAAQQLLVRLGPKAGAAHRVGITGVPGVGKSTFIEALGTNLTAAGHKVAVLAVDPTSSVTGGSILADKTRMQRLARDPAAFIRPSPSSGTLGGVTRTTRETMVVLEAAGFDVVLVETVGVGQSETLVHGMVDFFLVLMLAGAGDEFQGIKKGVLELADMLAVNKADGDNARAAQQAATAYRHALHLMTPSSPSWRPPVLTCSGLTNQGLDALWAEIEAHRAALTATGELTERRKKQQLAWMWSMVQDRLLQRLHDSHGVQGLRQQVEAELLAGQVTPTQGAEALLAAFDREAP